MPLGTKGKLLHLLVNIMLPNPKTSEILFSKYAKADVLAKTRVNFPDTEEAFAEYIMKNLRDVEKVFGL
jgi:hypothetical protein